jgi:hypothetical protein
MQKKIVFLLIAFISVGVVQAQSPKAIIINGNAGSIDQEAQDLIGLFNRHGYATIYLTGNSANWENVKTKAQGAAIFIYSGHGSSSGYNGTGGLCLNSNENTWGSNVVSSYTFEKDIQLASGAIVYFKSVCGGAGSSASDRSDIGIENATERVTSYSYPFFKMGASAYFASNYSGHALKVFQNLFEGNTLEDAFRNILLATSTIELIDVHTLDASKSVGIASNYSPGTSTVYITTYTGTKKENRTETFAKFREYNIAFAGRRTFKLTP